MAFTFLQNIAVGTHSAAVLEVKTRLKAQGWTVEDSGDGVNGALVPQIYGAGADVLTVSSVGAGYVAGSISNHSAWYRLRSPLGVGGPEFIFHHAAANFGSDAYGVLFIPKCVGTGTWAGAGAAGFGTPPAGCLVVPWGTSTVAGGGTIANQDTDPFDGDGSTARHMDFAFGGAAEGYAWYAFTRTAARRYYRGMAIDWIHADTLNPADEHQHVLLYTGGWTNTGDWLDSIGSARTSWGPFGGSNVGGENASNPSDFATTEGDPLVDEPSLNRQGRCGHTLLSPVVAFVTGNLGTDLGLNPYNAQVDVWRGSCWYYRSSHPEDFTARGSPRFPGLKGKSILFHFGGGGATDCALATGQNLVAMGSGRFWLPADSTVALTDPGGAGITAALTVNMHTFMDVTYADMTVEVEVDRVGESIADEPYVDPVMEKHYGPYEVFVNRVWDTVFAGQVSWTTTGAADTAGAVYPGPGVFGVDTSDFCVERYSIVR